MAIFKSMNWIRIAGCFGALSVALGAFGAHALKSKISPEMLNVWHTAVLYHIVHSVVLLALALFAKVSEKKINSCATFFAIGIILFSGSLYALSLTGVRLLGAITPLGGVFLIAGWVCTAWKMGKE